MDNQLKTAQKILKKIDRGPSITLTENQSEILTIILEVYREILMEHYNEEGFLEEDFDYDYNLEIANYFLRILHR